MPTAHAHDRGSLPPPNVREIGAGIFAYVQPDGSWGLNNTGFLVGRESVIAVDSCFTERRSRAFRDAIARLTPHPVRTLINTHSHGDHTYGNFVFGPGVTIVGHRLCREEILQGGTGATAIFPGVDWGDLRLAPPTLTLEDRLTLYLDDQRLELLFVGPAHTTNDVLVWLPERRLLFSGDIVFHLGTPFALGGSIAGWLAAMERVRALGAETIVPGHGPVTGPAVIDDVVAYLRFIQEAARRGFEAGLSPLQLARETDLGRFRAWHDSERLAGNLHRAYAELRGQPLGGPIDGPAAIADMIAYNGGQPLRCLA